MIPIKVLKRGEYPCSFEFPASFCPQAPWCRSALVLKRPCAQAPWCSSALVLKHPGAQAPCCPSALLPKRPAAQAPWCPVNKGQLIKNCKDFNGPSWKVVKGKKQLCESGFLSRTHTYSLLSTYVLYST
jgi:hypothetical protein